MRRWMPLGWILIFILTNAFPALAQAELAKALAELTALTSKVGSADTRTRVDALHRVRWIALSRTEADVKLKALELLREPVRTQGQTVVMVTHDPVAASYADQVVFLADGRLAGSLIAPTAEQVADRLTHLGARGKLAVTG